LLERCAKLSDELGGGSMTGLPIIETKGNDVSAFIPTNVISITDGQCFLETDLFNAGVRPAINVGVSVSRVGGSAQTKAMKKIAGRLRLDLAQFRELEAFAAFGSDLDAASKAQLERGARMVELLKQGQYSPYSLERQIVSIWAGTSGELDSVAVADIRRFESELLDFIGRERKDIFTVISETKMLEDDTVAKMKSAVADFKKQFKSSAAGIVNDAPADALDSEGAEALAQLGQAFAGKDQVRNAEKYYREALQIESENDTAIRGLIALYIQTGRRKEAFTLLASLNKSNPPTFLT
jgi:F-type H+-transporting ATPase subunit alpha